MTVRRHEDSPEARRLREAIASDLLALRQTFSRRGPGISIAGADIPEQVGRMLRSNPVWAAAAAAGALAGMWVGARNRFRRTPV
jgi:hypothetical protein